MCITRVVVIVNLKLMLVHDITFIYYVSNQSDLIHRDSVLNDNLPICKRKVIINSFWEENGYKDKWK